VRKTPDEDASRPVCCYREAMRITGLKKTKLYDLFRRGTLRGYRDGAMIRFYRESLLTYMKERENIPAPPPAPARPNRRPVKPPPGVRFKFL
jgi:excisionase family DNA binding protein